uniref:Bifunctional (P)ppGpp synthase/hydrolase n=1 Tax=Siphoviridae sp. ctQNW6 TaxID=2826328 RepID=A0A8S5QWJ4_9CAUD|nr:MAG TPA: Bifunctional (p)ppGpp synthase/hydrolase [Siphoviridae sp. ctQNW6]
MSSENCILNEKEIIPAEEVFHESCRKVLDGYISCTEGEREDFKDHAYRVYKIVKAYTSDDLPPEAASLSLIHDVADRMFNKKSTKYNDTWARNATDALYEFMDDENISHDQLKYSACLLADMVEIEQNAAHHRKLMAKIAEEESNDDYREAYSLVAERYMGKVSPDQWRVAQPLLDLDHMRMGMDKVNIEAFIIKGAEIMDNLQYPSSKRESAVLQDVLEAESFYAPILEAMGYEAFAAELRSVAKVRRLIGQGKEDLVKSAKEIQDRVLQVGMDKIADKIFGVNDGTINYAIRKDEDSGEYSTHMGEFAADTKYGNMVAGNWRIKTVGSLADKLKGGDGIMDIVGMMVISRDRETTACDFAHFIADRLKEFRPVCARSKNRPVYIQGTKEYVDAVEQNLRELGVGSDEYLVKIDTDEKREQRGYSIYEISKVTFAVDVDDVEVPVEIQFITKDERRRARTGEVSHIAYKYLQSQGFGKDNLEKETTRQRVERMKIVSLAKEVLGDLHKRRYDMINSKITGKLGINPKSLSSEDKFIERLIDLRADN